MVRRSDEWIYGDANLFECSMEEGDGVEVMRVGPPGSDITVVAVTTWVLNAELEELESGEFATRAPVMLLPEHARMMAAALINAADEADGLETSLLGEQMGELSE